MLPTLRLVFSLMTSLTLGSGQALPKIVEDGATSVVNRTMARNQSRASLRARTVSFLSPSGFVPSR